MIKEPKMPTPEEMAKKQPENGNGENIESRLEKNVDSTIEKVRFKLQRLEKTIDVAQDLTNYRKFNQHDLRALQGTYEDFSHELSNIWENLLHELNAKHNIEVNEDKIKDRF